MPALPVRTCVGCRVRAAKTELVRLVAVEGRLVPDPEGRRPGRGASLHVDPDCLERAQTRRAFARALRQQGPLDLSAVQEYVRVRTSTSTEQHDSTWYDDSTTKSAVTGTRPSDRKRVEKP